MGSGIVVTSLTVVDSTHLAAAISVSSAASNGPRTPTVPIRTAFARQHTSSQSILSDVYEMKPDGSALTQIALVGDVPGGPSWTG